jgi:hypothetical protein
MERAKGGSWVWRHRQVAHVPRTRGSWYRDRFVDCCGFFSPLKDHDIPPHSESPSITEALTAGFPLSGQDHDRRVWDIEVFSVGVDDELYVRERSSTRRQATSPWGANSTPERWAWTGRRIQLNAGDELRVSAGFDRDAVREGRAYSCDVRS